MKIMHEIMYKLEVLYVLCVLLMGRQRNQVGAPQPQSRRGESRLRITCGLSRCTCTLSSSAEAVGYLPPCKETRLILETGASALGFRQQL